MGAITNRVNRRLADDVGLVRAPLYFDLGLVDRAGPVKATLIRAAAGI